MQWNAQISLGYWLFDQNILQPGMWRKNIIFKPNYVKYSRACYCTSLQWQYSKNKYCAHVFDETLYEIKVKPNIIFLHKLWLNITCNDMCWFIITILIMIKQALIVWKYITIGIFFVLNDFLSSCRWQYSNAWSFINWCWMIANWKLKPITPLTTCHVLAWVGGEFLQWVS